MNVQLSLLSEVSFRFFENHHFFSINNANLTVSEDGMIDKEIVIEQIREVFDGNVYPGDAFLQGSFEGCEPYEEAGFFRGKMAQSIIEKLHKTEFHPTEIHL